MSQFLERCLRVSKRKIYIFQFISIFIQFNNNFQILGEKVFSFFKILYFNFNLKISKFQGEIHNEVIIFSKTQGRSPFRI